MGTTCFKLGCGLLNCALDYWQSIYSFFLVFLLFLNFLFLFFIIFYYFYFLLFFLFIIFFIYYFFLFIIFLFIIFFIYYYYLLLLFIIIIYYYYYNIEQFGYVFNRSAFLGIEIRRPTSFSFFSLEHKNNFLIFFFILSLLFSF